MFLKPTKGVVYGSQVAAPYISGLLQYVLPQLGYEPEDSDLASREDIVGNYVGEERDIAKERLNSLEARYEFVGEGDTVTAQIPEPGTRILHSGSKIILYLGDAVAEANVEVPDLVGQTVSAACQILENRELNVSFVGAQNSGAVVTAQSVAPGTHVPPGTVIELTIKYTDATD